MTTVRWLMAQRRLELSLRAGVDGLDRELDCAVSSELVSTADWLQGGEVLLTTGMRLSVDDPDGQREFVRSLDAVGAAAIGFGVGLGFDEVPADLLAAADEFGLPLFEVPLAIPFSAITRAVLDQIAAQRSARLVSATRAQPRMTRAATASGSKGLVRELADAVGQRVILLDAAHTPVAEAPGPARPDELEQIRAVALRDPASAGAVRVTDDSVLTVARVGSGTTTFGHLGVIGSSPLDDVGRMLIGHAVSLLAIEYAKPQQVRRDVGELQGEVLALAMERHIGERSREILSRAADPAGRVRAVVFRFEGVDDALRGARRLAIEFEHRWRPVFVHRREDEVVGLVRGDDHIQFATGLLTMLSSTGGVRGGLGPSVPVDDLADSVRQAKLSCRSAAAGQLVDLYDLRSLLASDSVREVLHDSYTERIAPLVAYDAANGGQLQQSLLAFLEANGNWGVAASVLGVHRHTLRGRIERVEDMLAVDLTDARTRAELLLTLLSESA
ncbi:PucR family transcriptional regulator [Gordonia otitidis]|uniref:PucR family transcriptional regulator n=1 Tax=Gordonia otitidis TaxID=249058 RepID=UPI0015775DAF|nr:PucR family transcriptional regulator [Gordonia otitidis]